MNIERLDLAKPVMAQFELTHSCNHKCLHCYRLDSNCESFHNEETSNETIMAVAKEIVNAHIFNVVITGGEPLIKAKLTQKIANFLIDNDVQVGLNSNITLLNEDMLHFIKERHINLLTSCPSSIREKYNYMVGTNGYDVFCEQLKKIYDFGIHCSVNMVVTKDNVQEIRDNAKFLKKMGCQFFSATPMFLNMNYPRKELLLSKAEIQKVIEDLLWVESNLKMEIDILESLPKCIFPMKIRNSSHSFFNRKCQAGRTVVGISPNGDVRPCSTNTYSYGNILREDIRVIWKRMKQWRSTDYFPDECKSCNWVDRCNAGCRINAKTFYGEWNSPDIWSTTPIKEEPISDYKIFNLEKDTKIKLNKNYCYREEYDGVFVIYVQNDGSFLMVNKDLMDFIILLQEQHFSTISDLSNIFNISVQDKDFLNTINLLINKKILEYEKI